MGMDPVTMMAGASLLSGVIGADSASSAADTQANAANNATALQKSMFDTTSGYEAPFRQGGTDALARLSTLLGIGGDSSQQGYGSLMKPFGMSDFQMDPGIQFQQKYGQQALQNSQAAKDGVLSGGAMKDLIGFNQGMAGTGYQSAFDRYMANKGFAYDSLMKEANLGQSAASNTANTGANYASGMSNTIVGAGQASAAGQIGVANALSGGINNASQMYFLRSLMGSGSGGGGGGGVGGAGMPLSGDPMSYTA
jgi:hypothetical protein